MRRFLLLLGAMLCLALPAQAHDSWAQPSTPARLLPGQPLWLSLSAGHGLQPLSAPKHRRQQRGLRLLSAAAPRRLGLGWVRQQRQALACMGPAPAGLSCVRLSLPELEIDLASAVVERYLTEVQPPAAVWAQWRAQQARGEPWRERYGKDAKLYLRSHGRGTAYARLRRQHQALELVAARDPTRLGRGARLPLRLLQQGQALADVALRCYDRQGERVLRTDARGLASLKLRCTGAHLLAAIVLQPPQQAGQPWRSRFVTLSFQVLQ